jgi:hypothetical protein
VPRLERHLTFIDELKIKIKRIVQCNKPNPANNRRGKVRKDLKSENAMKFCHQKKISIIMAPWSKSPLYYHNQIRNNNPELETSDKKTGLRNQYGRSTLLIW